MRAVSISTVVAAAFAAALSPAQASPLAAMSDAELAAVTHELLAWKASSVGQEAQSRGFVHPTSSSSSKPTADELVRFLNAKAAVLKLQQQQPSAVFSLDTPYALLTFDEYLARTGSTAEPPAPETTTPVVATAALNVSSTTTTLNSTRRLADSIDVDWQRAGCVTPVQHEGACNAGWAFAAVGAIETGYCARSPTRRLFALSEQDVLTCGTSTQCDHGITPDAFEYIVRYNGGSLCTEASLPYTRADYEPMPCRRVDDPSVTCDKPDLQVAAYVSQNFRDHRDLEAVVRERAVTAMIYLCPLMPPYWKVKNSVGDYWGDQGYGYMERGYQGHVYGTAGIEQWNAYPLFQWEVPPAFETTRVTGPRHGIEIVGTDLTTVPLMQYSPQQCGLICRREPGCRAYTYFVDNGTPVCRLKASVAGERRALSLADGTASGVIIAKQEMTTGLCLTPEDNMDFPGDDRFHALAASAAECCDMCFSDAGCNAYTWSQYHGGSCFLKSRRSVDPQATAPAADGTAYFRSGIAYKCQPLLFERDFPGGDLGSLAAKGPMDCCGLCRDFLGLCAGFTWTDYNGGTCWLKTAMAGSGVVTPGVFAAFV